MSVEERERESGEVSIQEWEGGREGRRGREERRRGRERARKRERGERKRERESEEEGERREEEGERERGRGREERGKGGEREGERREEEGERELCTSKLKPWLFSLSVKTNCSQVSSDNDIGHCIKHKPHIASVGCTCEVGVDLLLVSSPVQCKEALLDIVLGIIIRVGT